MTTNSLCPACREADWIAFHHVENAPVHSVLLLDSRAEAVDFTTRPIELAFCQNCGFIWNRLFEETVHHYGDRYEPTQGYSPTFNRFHEQLVDDLIGRFDLRNKQVVEIGCGQGEFLHLLCERGDNRGIGFDPAYSAEKDRHPHNPNVTFIQEFYDNKHRNVRGDFYVCKMTLEHISDVAYFVRTVRRAIGDQPNALIFFQVPAMERILDEAAFWDIYYEHCSYFTLGSLARLFRRQRFDVQALWRGYDDQYLMLVASPSLEMTEARFEQEDDLPLVSEGVRISAEKISHRVQQWQSHLQDAHARGERIVLWGGGSKGVAFLTTLAIDEEIRYVVDINPHKAGTFMAGSGQEIVTPTYLSTYRPDRVIIMNPIYRSEISAMLTDLGLTPIIETVLDHADL